jgi:prevent-host-death family protein
MIKVNIFEIKAKLSEYLDRAANGHRILIYRHNKAIAELRGVEDTPVDPRPIGPLPGRPVFKIPASFFDPLPDDEMDLWDGIKGSGASAKTKPVGRKPRGNRPRGKAQ